MNEITSKRFNVILLQIINTQKNTEENMQFFHYLRTNCAIHLHSMIIALFVLIKYTFYTIAYYSENCVRFPECTLSTVLPIDI